ncbi:zinc ribbon domain-containing protein [Crateriforma conspicua]|uniref:hypothetical protein n=1 Tax=Crateriforma conspicua TaxID=2527996 RepID=UPI00118CF48E|nr:hypothetical protein [Crateriforma conspicua]QDV63645.1 hypothetical protein Mal65_27910 [Crateriforma conspicua]
MSTQQRLSCPSCGKSVRISSDHAGKKVRCPHCQMTFLVPGAAPQANDDDDWLNLDDVTPKADAPPAAKAKKPLNPATASKKPATPKAKPKPTPPDAPVDDDPLFGDLPEGDDLFGDGSGGDGDDLFGDIPDLPDLPPPSTTRGSGSTPGTSPTAVPVQYETQYRVRCKVCDSPTDVTADQAGQTIQCYDCHSPIVVPPPPKVVQKPKVDLDQVESFSFSNTAESSRPADPFMKSAKELLDSAEREEIEEEPENYDTPDIMAWFADVFGVFKDPSVVMYAVLMSVLGGGASALVAAFWMVPILPMGLFVGVIIFAAMTLACGFAIMEAVANEADEITGWPEVLDPMTWFGPLVTCVAAIGLVSAPAAFLGLAVFGSNALVTLFLVMASIYALFPFVLLSMLDMQSVFAPFSPEVARSATRCREAWGGFYFSAGLLFVVLYLSYLMFTVNGSPYGVFAAVSATVVVTFLYFAMLGRLAYSIGQTVNEISSPDDHEPSETIPEPDGEAG